MTARTPDWRTKETHEAYLAKIATGHNDTECRLCLAPSIKEYQYWRLITNDFPYDRVAAVHHMIIPKRHSDGDDLNEFEIQEYRNLLKTDLNTGMYNYILQSLPKNMSIPGHLHYHLLQAKTFTDIDV